MNEQRLIFDLPFALPVTAGLAATFITLALLAYRRTARPVSADTRAILQILRFFALMLALLGLVRPVMESRDPRNLKMSLPILVDATRSLEILDGGPGISRREQLRVFLRDNDGALEKLAERFEVAFFEFDQSARRVRKLSGNNDGSITSIARSLEEGIAAMRGKRIAAMLVISDGASTADKDISPIVERLAATDVPVYAIGLGTDVAGKVHRDTAMLRIRAKAFAFTGVSVPVQGEFSMTGLSGKTVMIEALEDGKVFDKRTFTAAASVWKGSVRFAYLPSSPGAHKITLKASAAGDELVMSNNALSTYVNVVSGGLSVGFLEASVRPEAKYIRRSLTSSRRIQANFMVKRPGQSLASGEGGGQSLLATFDVIVLGDLPAGNLGDAEMKEIEKSVSEGKGLVFLASRRSLGLGGYATTRLRALSPVSFSGGDAWVEDLVKLRLTEEGAAHAALRLARDPSESAGAWNALAECLGYLSTGSAKPTSQVLAQTQDGRPAIVVGKYGLGRTVAVLVDSTWRWVLSEADTATAHERFWQQLFLFAGGRDAKEENRLWIEMADFSYALEQNVLFTAKARDAEDAFPPDLEMVARHVTPDGRTEPITLDEAAGAFAGVVRPLIPGDHRIVVEATRKGEPFASTAANFLVTLSDAEFEQLTADFDALENLAEKTSGRFEVASSGHRILDELLAREDTYELLAVTRTELWNSVTIFIIITALLCAEWLVRKRHSLP